MNRFIRSLSRPLKAPKGARPGSSDGKSTPERVFGSLGANSPGNSQYLPFASLTTHRAEYPESQQATDPNITSYATTSEAMSQPSRPVPEKPTRLDLIEDTPQVYSLTPTLEEEVVLPQEVERRSQQALLRQKSTFHPIEGLILPEKIDHPEAKDYIAAELKTRPKWLWDSHQMATVLAKDYMFDEGYVAVSYTWGRWRVKDGWYQSDGTPWQIPSINPHNHHFPEIKCKFSITELKDILCRMPNVRYFWVDVLCINQYPQTILEMNEKAIEIEKQGSIFKGANGVLVYLWSVDNGEQLTSAVDELGSMMRWYWQINVSRTSPPRVKRNSRDGCVEKCAPVLRNDPWFSSLWTLQEMVLAPHSVWIARDGSHCHFDGQVLTTHATADIFQDFIVRERFYDVLGSSSRDPSRNYVQSNIDDDEIEPRKTMERWLKWAFQKTSITTCIGSSRAGVLLATLQRKYTARREMAVLAALRIGNQKHYETDANMVDDLAVSLWNELIQSEGGRLFDNNQSRPLANMLPSTADTVSSFFGIREQCSNWELKANGDLKIARGSAVGDLSTGRETQYQFPNKPIFGGDPVDNVKNYLSGLKKYCVRHVRFIIIGYQTPYSQVKGGAWEYTGIRGVILVTEFEDILREDCVWYKAGMFFSRDFCKKRLDHDITVGYSPPLTWGE